MDATHLEAVLALERQDASAFQPLPFHYIEIAHLLFTAGTDAALPAEVQRQKLLVPGSVAALAWCCPSRRRVSLTVLARRHIAVQCLQCICHHHCRFLAMTWRV